MINDPKVQTQVKWPGSKRIEITNDWTVQVSRLPGSWSGMKTFIQC